MYKQRFRSIAFLIMTFLFLWAASKVIVIKTDYQEKTTGSLILNANSPIETVKDFFKNVFSNDKNKSFDNSSKGNKEGNPEKGDITEQGLSYDNLNDSGQITNKNITGAENSTNDSNNSTDLSENDANESINSINKEQAPTCLSKFNLNDSTIIFYFSNDPHSQTMIPIVDELKGNYSFYSTNELWDYEFNQRFGLSGTVPMLVCAGSKDKIEGEVTKTELEDFCKRCSN